MVDKTPTMTKNIKIYSQINRSCAIKGCPVETDLVAISSSYCGLGIDFYICQKHLGGNYDGK